MEIVVNTSGDHGRPGQDGIDGRSGGNGQHGTHGTHATSARPVAVTLGTQEGSDDVLVSDTAPGPLRHRPIALESLSSTSVVIAARGGDGGRGGESIWWRTATDVMLRLRLPCALPGHGGDGGRGLRGTDGADATRYSSGGNGGPGGDGGNGGDGGAGGAAGSGASVTLNVPVTDTDLLMLIGSVDISAGLPGPGGSGGDGGAGGAGGSGWVIAPYSCLVRLVETHFCSPLQWLVLLLDRVLPDDVQQRQWLDNHNHALYVPL